MDATSLHGRTQDDARDNNRKMIEWVVVRFGAVLAGILGLVVVRSNHVSNQSINQSTNSSFHLLAVCSKHALSLHVSHKDTLK